MKSSICRDGELIFGVFIDVKSSSECRSLADEGYVEFWKASQQVAHAVPTLRSVQLPHPEAHGENQGVGIGRPRSDLAPADVAQSIV